MAVKINKAIHFRISKMKNIFTLILTLIFLINTSMANGADCVDNSCQSLFSDFRSEELVRLTITTNINRLLENRKKATYQNATVEWKSANGNTVTLQADIRARGKYRNRVCDFPPIKLKFSKKELSEMGYSSYNKMKLVTHCIDGGEEGNQNVIKEYLAYRMYNEITDYSFRVQLVEVEYIDAQHPETSDIRYGIIIEHKKEMAARLNADIKKDLYNPNVEQINASIENKMALFNYMLGNEDYSTVAYKNIEWIQDKTTGKLIPVPYDFDFSGFVNPSYARVPSSSGHKSNKERKFLGLPVNDNIFNANIAKFLAKEKKIVQLVRKNRSLNLEQRLEAISYIRSFYTKLRAVQKNDSGSLYQSILQVDVPVEKEGYYGHPLY